MVDSNVAARIEAFITEVAPIFVEDGRLEFPNW
jgi:hypothetical protein